MRSKRSVSRRIGHPQIIERSLVLAVLDDNHAERWTRTELEREHFDVEPADVASALERPCEAGVVVLDGEEVWALPTARYLNGLGMICV
jgi:hypothetical protein